MSACPDKEMMLHGLIDGELDAMSVLAIEAHVGACPGCAEELERLMALKRLIRAPGVAFQAPAGLAERIEAAIDGEAERPRRRLAAMAPWAVSGVMSAVAASLALVMFNPTEPEAGLESEVISDHVRSLQASHLTDVATSDRHTVKPWFNGKIDFAPPVVDLAAQGYPLAGGRLDYLHQHTVAALVFRRRRHVINLFVWPSKPGETISGLRRRDGYSLVYWTAGGLEFWAVSDIDTADLETFARAYRAAT